MKKISAAVLAILLTLMTACTQYVFVPGDIFPGFGGNNSISQQDRTDAIAMMNYLQSDSFLTKVKDGDSGLTITRTVQSAVSSGTRMRSVMNQRSVGSSFLATITFNPSFVDNEAGVSITSGTIEMEFNTVKTGNDTYAITAADVSVTNTLSYSVNGNSGTFSMSYTGGPASGTISTSTGDSSFSFSSEITISASGNISITLIPAQSHSFQKTWVRKSRTASVAALEQSRILI